MEIPITDLGQKTNLDVIRQFVSLNELNLIDVGCGDMGFTRTLIDEGANVLALDPDPIQAKSNREAELPKHLRFVESVAQRIPVEDGSVDGVFFAYSLHHIPETDYPEVFEEVVRILKPSGFLYVIEPIACPLNEVMKLFHDEDQVRAAAQAALRDIAVPLFDTVKIVQHHGHTEYESFDKFVEHFGGRSFNSLYSVDDVQTQQVAQAFERLGGPERRFQSPKQVMFLKNTIE